MKVVYTNSADIEIHPRDKMKTKAISNMSSRDPNSAHALVQFHVINHYCWLPPNTSPYAHLFPADSSRQHASAIIDTRSIPDYQANITLS